MSDLTKEHEESAHKFAVWFIQNRGMANFLTVDELCSPALMGLWKASKTHKAEAGVSLYKWQTICMSSEVYDYLRYVDPCPRPMRQKLKAQKTDIDTLQASKVFNAIRDGSADLLLLRELPSNMCSAHEAYVRKEEKQLVRESLARYFSQGNAKYRTGLETKRNRKIFEDFYYGHKLQKDLCSEHDLTPGRVSQILKTIADWIIEDVQMRNRSNAS